MIKMWKYLRTCKRCGECYEAITRFGKICSKCSQARGGRYSTMRRRKQKINIKEEAQAYEPKQIKNIADLDKVAVNLDLEEKTYKEGTVDEYKVKIVVIDGVSYRVPPIVLGQLKEQLKENDDLEFFKVKKTGQGKEGTNYTVVPILK